VDTHHQADNPAFRHLTDIKIGNDEILTLILDKFKVFVAKSIMNDHHVLLLRLQLLILISLSHRPDVYHLRVVVIIVILLDCFL